jgi:hypothetical protein
MPFDIKSKKKIIIILALLLATIIAFICFYYQIRYPPCCDADGYIRMAKSYLHSGISLNESELDNLRLYGYPLFLSWIIKLSNIIGVQYSYILFLTQLILYFIGVYFLSYLVSTNYSFKIGLVVFYALLANIVIYPYLGVALTDGFTAILHIYIISIVLKVFSLNESSDDTLISIFFWLLLLGGATGFSIMVRPASIYLLLPISAVLVIFIISQIENRLLLGTLTVLSVSIGFLITVTPQVIYNFASFRIMSFMPVADLGASQFDWGTHVLKYLTNLSGGNLQMCYFSPWSEGSHGVGLRWYFDNPLIGFKTIFIHLYGVLDFDYYFPYVYNLKNKYRPILFLFSQFVLYWGIVGFFSAVQELKAYKNRLKTTKSLSVYRLTIFAFPCLLIGWSGVHAFSGSENRWSLPIVAALLPFAVWVVFAKSNSLKNNMRSYGIFVLYLIFAAMLSNFIAGLMRFCS